MNIAYTLLGFLGLASLLAYIALWVVSLYQAFTRTDIDGNRILWILLILFVNPLGTIIYFFVEDRKKFGWYTLASIGTIFLTLGLFLVTFLNSGETTFEFNGNIELERTIESTEDNAS